MPARRVLLVTDWMPQPGGSETYMSRLRQGLLKAGDQVRLLTSTAGSAAEGAADYRAFGTTNVALQAGLQIANPFAFRVARRACREFEPDVALVHLFAYHLSPFVVLGLGDLPIVQAMLDYKAVCPLGSKLLPDGALCRVRAGAVCYEKGCLPLVHWLRDRPRYAAIRRAVGRATIVLACSRHMAMELEANGIASRPIVLPVSNPGPGYERRPLDHPQFVYCGRLNREKGVLLLVRAFAKVRTAAPDARLTFVGDGPLRMEIERLADALRIADAVAVTGWLDAAGVDRHLSTAWALVAPSLWAEPFGHVAPEAIVRSVPVVASRTGGLGETIEEGTTGLLFENGDEQALTRCLERIALGDDFPTHTLEAAAVERVAEAYGLDRHVSAIQAVLDEAIACHQRNA